MQQNYFKDNMHDFKPNPINLAIGVVWGLWTAAPMAINQRILKRIKQNEQ
jgi:hypothetical protein